MEAGWRGLRWISIKEDRAIDWTSTTLLVTGGTGSFGRRFADLMLREYQPRKLIVYSRDEWKQRAQKRTSLPVLQSHGRFDTVLQYGQAERLRDLLKEAGLAVEFLPFNGPHTIAPEVLERMAEFLHTRLTSR